MKRVLIVFICLVSLLTYGSGNTVPVQAEVSQNVFMSEEQALAEAKTQASSTIDTMDAYLQTVLTSLNNDPYLVAKDKTDFTTEFTNYHNFLAQKKQQVAAATVTDSIKTIENEITPYWQTVYTRSYYLIGMMMESKARNFSSRIQAFLQVLKTKVNTQETNSEDKENELAEIANVETQIAGFEDQIDVAHSKLVLITDKGTASSTFTQGKQSIRDAQTRGSSCIASLENIIYYLSK